MRTTALACVVVSLSLSLASPSHNIILIEPKVTRQQIWSVRFSHDAREVVAGARSGLVLVYDVEAQRTTLRVRAHQDDTNAVAFASASDSNLLVSGSDDCFVKVWDRRSLDGERPSGVCVGHTEGVTFVSVKGDGRYILSNGKDQGMKLWECVRVLPSSVSSFSLLIDDGRASLEQPPDDDGRARL